MCDANEGVTLLELDYFIGIRQYYRWHLEDVLILKAV
jgi:hypothetical protein